MTQSYPFLEERLSAFRAEYIGQIEAGLPALLEAFDSVVLEGFSEDKDSRYRQNSPRLLVELHGEPDRPVYDDLTARLRTAGSGREEFLYGLRRALVEAQGMVKGIDARLNAISAMEVASLFIVRLEDLRGVSSAYRDIYKVMVDIVRQELGRQV